ncbi:MAG: hypothetical protein ACI8PT_004041 [Gammaproteobacteria bacterium]|jgi:hypothetical protein
MLRSRAVRPSQCRSENAWRPTKAMIVEQR